MRVLAAERSARKPARGWGSSLGRAGEALSGFCRGCNRRAPHASNSASRRRLHPRQVPDRLRCPGEGRTPPLPHHPKPQPTDPSTSRGRCPPEAAVDVDLPHHNTRAGSRRDVTNRPDARVEDDRRKDDERRTRSGMERSAMPERRKADHQPSTRPTGTPEAEYRIRACLSQPLN